VVFSTQTVYCTVVNAQRRLLEVLGIERKARDISPTLSDMLRGPPL
jgi:hypothetical protein